MSGIAPVAEMVESLPQLADRINSSHASGEQASRRGLEHFRAAGEALIAAKSRCGHGAWLKWLKENVDCSQSMASKYMRFAKLEGTSNLEAAWRLLLGNEDHDTTPHVKHNSGENEWYTPSKYLEATRKALGTIDLDPASSAIAQEMVQAGVFFTARDDGLSKDWRGRVWLNPPYAAGLVEKFVSKLCAHFIAGDLAAAVLLVNNATETTWFQEALGICSAVCFPARRLRFIDATGQPANSPLQGQSFLYFGENVDLFAKEFGQFGNCVRSISKFHD